MSIILNQASFSAGELAPEMLGRVDLQHYQTGLELALNYFVDYHGGISNRPGTYHKNYVTTPVRLIPFERSVDEVFFLEFGEKTIKIRDVAQTGDYVKNQKGQDITLQSPYAQSEMPFVRFVQSVDVMTLIHQNHAPHQIKHYARDRWTIEPMLFKHGPYADINNHDKLLMWMDRTGEGDKNGVTPKLPGKTEDVIPRLKSDFDVFTPEMVGSMVYLEAPNDVFTPSWSQRVHYSNGMYVHYAGNYYKAKDGKDNALTGDSPPVHLKGVRWDGPNRDLPLDNDSHTIGIAWEYVHSGFGEVRITKFRNPQEVEVEIVTELPPEIYYNPNAPTNQKTFSKTSLWAFYGFLYNNYPKCGAYYSSRLNFASNREKPQTMWSSRTDAYDDFGTSKPLLAEDSMTLNMAGIKLNDIEHLLPLNALLAFTSGGIWAISSSQPKRLSAEEPPAFDIQSYNGVSYLPPEVVGTECLYIDKSRRSIKELQYDLNQSSFVDVDLCVRSSHLFKRRKIVSWTYANNPHRLVWVVFDDGTAATLTYLKEQKIWGWTRHETNGRFLSVSSIEGDERTEVFFVVQRQVANADYYSVERLARRVFRDVDKQMHFVDNGLYFNHEGAQTAPLVISPQTNGLHIVRPETVQLSQDDVGKQIVVRYQGQTYALTIIEITQDTNQEQLCSCRAEQLIPAEMMAPSVVFGHWGVCENEIDGLQHLEGETVIATVDGFVDGPHEVHQGKITLSKAGLHVHVGLAYQSIARTLPLEVMGDGSSTTQQRVKSVNKVTMKVMESRGGLAGTKLDKLYEVKLRDDESYRAPVDLRSGLVDVEVSSSYNQKGQFYFLQRAPLPFNVLSVMPEVEFGD